MDGWLEFVQSVSLCGRQLRRALGEAAWQHGLSDVECLVLWSCNRKSAAQHELAASLGVSPAQMSGLVERLGRRGWLESHRPAYDRRRQYWRLTEEGQAHLARVLSELPTALAALFEVLSPAERQELQRQLELLIKATSRLENRPAREAA